MRAATVARVQKRIGLITTQHPPKGPTMFTLLFWKDVLERALKTFAYSTLGALPVGAATQNFAGVPWLDAALVGASATVLSVLGSIASVKAGNSGTASLTKAVEPATPTVATISDGKGEEFPPGDGPAIQPTPLP